MHSKRSPFLRGNPGPFRSSLPQRPREKWFRTTWLQLSKRGFMWRAISHFSLSSGETERLMWNLQRERAEKARGRKQVIRVDKSFEWEERVHHSISPSNTNNHKRDRQVSLIIDETLGTYGIYCPWLMHIQTNKHMFIYYAVSTCNKSIPSARKNW